MEANMAKEVYVRKFKELEEIIEKINEGQLSLNITLVSLIYKTIFNFNFYIKISGSLFLAFVCFFFILSFKVILNPLLNKCLKKLDLEYDITMAEKYTHFFL